MFVSWVVVVLAEIGFVVECGGVKLAISLEGFFLKKICFDHGGMCPCGLRVRCSSSGEG
jgi:hypothetical protein